MSGIFLSYASQDRERVRPIVRGLQEHGWEVWWDREIPPGMTWPQVIEKALSDTRAMVVVWTEASVASEWVQIETAEGKKRGGLVPVSLDRVTPPLEFRRIQSADLVDWNGSATHPQFRAVVAELENTLGASRKGPGVAPAGGGRLAPLDLPSGTPASDATNAPIWIAGGTFQMGSNEGYTEEQPVHRVSVSDFWIQEHQVTNEEYRGFAPGHDFPSGRERHPVVNVSWQQAVDYANSRGGSLPTEAQWEFAARGTSGRTYPWGDMDPTCQRAHYKGCDPGLTLPVMSRPEGATPEGVNDLAGNVLEWTADQWHESYAGAPDDGSAWVDGGSGRRVLRGGSFDLDPSHLRAAARNVGREHYRLGYVGFRVVWSSA